MKHFIKLAITIVLGLTFLFNIDAINVRATSDSVIQETEEGLYYDTEYDRTFNTVYKVIDGETIEISIEEYIEMREQEKNAIELTNKTINKESTSQIAPSSLLYSYSPNRTSVISVRGDRVSQIVHCPQASCSLTVGYSATKSFSATMSLSAGQKSAIGAGAGFTWTDSATVSSSATLNIPAGKRGWWEFDPRMNFTTGILRNRLTGSSWNINAYSPITLSNGTLDGTLVGVID